MKHILALLALAFGAVLPAAAAEVKTTVAHVRLAGVYYGDRASTNAETNVGEPFTHWVVTAATPVPADAKVLRVVTVGDDLKAGRQRGLDGATFGHLYTGPSE